MVGGRTGGGQGTTVRSAIVACDTGSSCVVNI